ncbi:MAG: hypothetical protein ACK443_11040 [Methylococcaceae bacterium]|jgi:hypothetical protein
MSGLLRNPVNPLTNSAPPSAPAPAPAPVEFSNETGEIYDPSPEALVPSAIALAAATAATTPQLFTPAVSLPVSTLQDFEDGFDDAETDFGAFPRIKLDNGWFWNGNEKIGTSFSAHMCKMRKVYIYNDRQREHPTDITETAYTYDNVYTTKGVLLESVFAEWKAKGHHAPILRVNAIVTSLIKDGPYAGQVVELSVAKQSIPKLAGYRDSLYLTRGKRISQVITRVKVGEPIKTSSGTTFTPWAFEYVEDLIFN